MPKPLYEQIYGLVRQVPGGRVTTYGAVARQLGCTARTVGFAMAALSQGSDVPWQRVINSQGRVSVRVDGYGNIIQKELLLCEGIEFDSGGRVDLKRYAWDFDG